jgi:outer membrane lipoprotein-sorting protein
MKTTRKRFGAFLVLSITSACALAAGAGPEFSADTLQRGPGGQVSSGRMFVGDGRVRMEMAAQGQNLVRITDEKRRVEWVLFPEQKSYMERKAGPDQGGPAPDPAAMVADPCADAPGLTCRKLGEETVGGRAAVKWELTGQQEGRPMTITQWLDKERGIPLQQQFPDGGKMALSIQGKENLEGRAVEKWEVLIEAPGRQPSRTFQWYDPELKLAIREELPGGGVREMKNIRVGKQPDDLFVVPAGYTRAADPEGPPPGR